MAILPIMSPSSSAITTFISPNTKRKKCTRTHAAKQTVLIIMQYASRIPNGNMNFNLRLRPHFRIRPFLPLQPSRKSDSFLQLPQAALAAPSCSCPWLSQLLLRCLVAVVVKLFSAAFVAWRKRRGRSTGISGREPEINVRNNHYRPYHSFTIFLYGLNYIEIEGTGTWELHSNIEKMEVPLLFHLK